MPWWMKLMETGQHLGHRGMTCLSVCRLQKQTQGPSVEDSLHVYAIHVMETDLYESVFGLEGTFKGHLV